MTSPRFEVVAGGSPSPEEVAAIAAALAVVLDTEPPQPPVSRWRWSGRPWLAEGTSWRGPRLAAHAARP